jgi:hypothetical protein
MSDIAPVLVKSSEEREWMDEPRLFYILGRDGLYRCRNHEFFESCVKTDQGPSGLEEQRTFLRPRFPKIPRALFEQAVGFFSRVADHQGSEAAMLLLWDRRDEQVRLVVPPQKATMYRAWDGRRSPIGIHYEIPADLPADWVPFGDIHSHVHYAAYASSTDVADETHAAGLHVVVGRIHEEPPDLHVEAVVDAQRFVLSLEQVVEGYRARSCDIPHEWIERVEIEDEGSVLYPRGVS